MARGSPVPADDAEELRAWTETSGPVEIAAEVDRADPGRREAVFDALDPKRVLDVFCRLEPVVQAQMLDAMDTDAAGHLFGALEPDDRVRVLGELPAPGAERLLGLLSASDRSATTLLFQYPPESAGRIMSPHFVALRPDMSVAEALSEVRRQGPEAETVYYLPLVDGDMRFQGAVSLEELVMAELGDRITEVGEPRRDAFPVDADQEVVARYIQEADLLAVAVVEAGDRLVGVVTVDDAMDVLRMEETEDVARTGAAEPLRRPYFSVSTLELVKSRVVWLSLLALAAILTVNVLAAFETTLERVVALALFIPLLIGIGGNTGAQSATTIVRAVAIDDVRAGDFFRVGLREAGVGTLMGATLAAAAFLVVGAVFGWEMATVVALTMVVVCTLAAVVGSLMPLAAQRLGVDPAVVSAPFVTTIVDASGLLVYFLIARSVLAI